MLTLWLAFRRGLNMVSSEPVTNVHPYWQRRTSILDDSAKPYNLLNAHVCLFWLFVFSFLIFYIISTRHLQYGYILWNIVIMANKLWFGYGGSFLILERKLVQIIISSLSQMWAVSLSQTSIDVQKWFEKMLELWPHSVMMSHPQKWSCRDVKILMKIECQQTWILNFN